MAIIRGTVNDDIRGGTSGHDIFQFFQGGEDTLSGHRGNDIFKLGGALSAGDVINGGTGVDRLYLNGDYSGGFTFGDDALVSVEHIRVEGNFDYALTMSDANVVGHQALTVHADGLGAGHALTFDGSAETTGHFVVFGSAGNDALTGGARNDRFWLDAGGTDTAHGGGGNDLFKMGAAFDSSDSIDGGAGYDKITLNGDYSGGLTLNGNTIHAIEEIDYAGSANFQLQPDNGNVAPGERLVIDASQSTGVTTFLGFNETDGGSFTIITGSNAQNTVYGGSGNDVADFRHAGHTQMTFDDPGGDDTVYIGTNYPISPNFNGGTGNDTFVLDGDYSSFQFKGGVPGLRSFETIKFTAGHDYGTFFDALTATGDVSSTAVNGASSGATVTWDGSELGFNDTFHLDLSGSSAAAQIIKGGGGADQLTGNGNNDTFIGGLGGDSMNGGAGHDTFVVNDVSESTSWTYDAPVGIDFDNDKIDLNIAAPAAIDTAFSGGTLNNGSQSEFDNDMETAVGPTQLLAGHAVIWTPGDGGFSGFPMLIVDGNNTAGYQAGQDYVFFISGYMGTIDPDNFI